jgi:hypothetical protein
MDVATRTLAMLALMAIPACADDLGLAGTWHGPQVLHLLADGTWMAGSRHGDWRPEGAMLRLQPRLRPEVSYLPPVIACSYSLSAEVLALGDCLYAGTYKR